MRKHSNTTIKVPEGEYTPAKIPLDIKRICNWNGIYYRGVETKDFVYFINYNESDENASVIMFRKLENELELASSNYFAYNDLFELQLERAHEITYLSPMAKYGMKNLKEMYPEG